MLPYIGIMGRWLRWQDALHFRRRWGFLTREAAARMDPRETDKEVVSTNPGWTLTMSGNISNLVC